MLKRTVAWQGIDDVRRQDTASVRLDRDRLTATGTSRTPDYQLDYTLRTGSQWITRSLDVRVAGTGWTRELALIRDTSGHWRCEGRASGIPVTAAGLPLVIDGSDWSATDVTQPGIVDGRSLAGADDCDLGLCPVTNTMPMLRSVLRRAAPAGRQPGPEVECVMAWVEVPSLRVIASEQLYQLRRTDVDGTAVVRYVGLHRSFEGDLTVDRDGLVIDYPQLARRVAVPG
ncbi:MAG: putative glycolipid-binding domain-containing protein [Nakamurella sp.]